MYVENPLVMVSASFLTSVCSVAQSNEVGSITPKKRTKVCQRRVALTYYRVSQPAEKHDILRLLPAIKALKNVNHDLVVDQALHLFNLSTPN